MSLSSPIISEGRDMGIAEAVQSQVAGVELTGLMDLILLKSKGDSWTQMM
ncbi:MAG TPA: hypothetical protein HA349_09695 [Methanotrichaceae archaeon]|nr:hypothetical protein [Methanotrichaceae archaeon]